MTLPSREVVAQLDADRRAVAHHEIGHAVTALAIGLPVHEVYLAYQHHQRLLLSDWSVAGRTEVAPDGGTVSGTADQELLFLLGGLESEAIYRERCGDGTLTACRSTVANISVNQRGDLPQLQAVLADRAALAAAIGVRDVTDTQRPAEVALDERDLRVSEQRSEHAEREGR